MGKERRRERSEEKERGPRVLPEVGQSAEGLKSSLYSCVMFYSVYVDFLSTTANYYQIN